MLLNCRESPAPCGSCPACRQLVQGVHRDLWRLSGEEGTIKIEDVRALRRSMSESPEHGRTRVFLLSEAQELTVAAANGLLKSLEEPLPGNVFVLLAPQRNWLLPTLVSRSYVLTLKWCRPEAFSEESVPEWIETLMTFWQSGQGLFEKTGAKNAVDRHRAERVLTACEQSLVEAMTGEPSSALSAYWADRLNRTEMATAGLILDKGQQALGMQANPSLVLDWVALQFLQRLGLHQA
jgi:DNA polymerase-3 subunit delta'